MRGEDTEMSRQLLEPHGRDAPHGAPAASRPGPLPQDPSPALPPVQPRTFGDVLRDLANSPHLRLLVYYTALVALALVLIQTVPAVRRALVTPAVIPALSQGAELLSGRSVPTTWAPERTTLAALGDRAVTTLLVIVGAISLVLPVAWVYMSTKRLRYDPALVRSVVILPIVVAGIAVVVKNSLALAFSLAGIVAAVRFRNTLKDPRDAVYIFLTIAIGLSAGVQALDVALVMSVIFNFMVLTLWQFNVGSIYGGQYGRTGVLAIGDAALLVAQTPAPRKRLRVRLLTAAESMKTHGILLVHSAEPELARDTVQEALSEMAKDWRLVEVVPRGDGLSTLEYLVRLKKKTTAAELVGALDERWSSQVDAAEFVPFRARREGRDAGAAGDDDE